MRTRLLFMGFLLVLFGSLGACDPAGDPPPPADDDDDSTPDPDQDLWDELDASVEDSMEDEWIPGASLAVLLDGTRSHVGSYGLADVEAGTPVEADTLFRIGSITKAVTSCVVLLLQEEGLLDLEDGLAEWLPDFGLAGDITLRQLLTHTSGLADWDGGWYFENQGTEHSPEEMLAEAESRGIVALPGDSYFYSNIGYYLLALVVEAADGQSYHEAVRQRIFEPLAMEDSYAEHYEFFGSGMSRGYRLGDEDGTWEDTTDDLHQSNNLGSGNLTTSVPDLLTWWVALNSGELISQASYDDMVTPATLNDGSPTEYGLGVGIRETENAGWYVGVDGGVEGFGAVAFHLPERGIDVAVAVNLTGAMYPPVLAALDLLGEAQTENE